ncbi:hypothetical protein [Halosimplex salinum]|uniref:hypothetical protein n=1 Tax=Halosimplex salinum TaxID=1710538 RepID=UPI000F495424|nr:hypothetical protein [Halosimplex salinum]
MSDRDNSRTTANAHEPEVVPPEKRLGHERGTGDDPVVDTAIEDGEGNEWFTVGNANGVVCTLDPVDVEP